MKDFCAVILAAGSSRRLGTNKLTLKIDGEPVVRKATMPFLLAGVGKVIVVTGEESEGIRAALTGLSVDFVVNRDHMHGMSTSARTALPLIGDVEGAFFHLGDKPFLEPPILHTMVEIYREKKGIICPVYDGKKGHPVLMDVKRYRAEMEQVSGDRGLREVLEKNGQDVIFISGNEGSLFDIDTENEIAVLRKRGYRVEKG